MGENLEQCNISVSGKHRFTLNEEGNDECALCGLLRSTIESKKEESIPSPYMSFLQVGEVGNSKFQTTKSGENKYFKQPKRKLSKETLDNIIKEGEGESAIVLVFDKDMMSWNGLLPPFRISAKNIHPDVVPAVLYASLEAIVKLLEEEKRKK